MPVNNRFPVEELLDSCRYYISKTNRRVSFEWALINGQTDTPASAKELGKLLQGMLCHVNVIPLNPTKGYAGQPTRKVCNTCEPMRHDCNVYDCHRLGLMSLFGYWVSTVWRRRLVSEEASTSTLGVDSLRQIYLGRGTKPWLTPQMLHCDEMVVIMIEVRLSCMCSLMCVAVKSEAGNCVSKHEAMSLRLVTSPYYLKHCYGCAAQSNQMWHW